MRPQQHLLLPALAVAVAVVMLPGCVRRTIRITSDPAGALVWVNDREVGRTPVEFSFVHYGTYDVRLVKNGYEAVLASGDARPPWWDNLGLDFIAEVAPLELHSSLAWHYEMEPVEPDPASLRAGLLGRAVEMRERAGVLSAP